jgi:hypothetical protein
VGTVTVATYQAITSIGQALIGLLERACPKPEFAAAQFALYQASDFTGAQPRVNEGVSLYLYRVATNGPRNLPNRVAPDGTKFLPPLSVDLYYLVTPWAKTPERQQLLLGWAMRALEDSRVVPAGLLNDQAAGPGVFRPDEDVELVSEPLSLADMYNIWDPFKPVMQLSAAYMVRQLEIDSNVALGEGGPVRTRVFDRPGVTVS